MSKLSVVVGGQFGSEAKGAVTAALTRQALANKEHPVVIRVAGPNAGHTAYDAEGRAWALRQVPVGMVVDRNVIGVIADGSEVDLPVLLDEIAQLNAAGLGVSHRLYVSEQASLLTEAHHTAEERAGIHGRIGSTGKGIGECRADRLMRRVPTLGQVLDEIHKQVTAGVWSTAWDGIRNTYYPKTPRTAFPATNDLMFLSMSNTSFYLKDVARQTRAHLIIEGTQGYGLGLHAGHYPQCTSSDTRAIDFLAMAGVNPWDRGISKFRVWVVARAFPIRVAGNSGPLNNETTWEELGLPVELTTVTKKPRRVGLWDQDLLDEAIDANGGTGVVRVAFSMADQEFPALAGETGTAVRCFPWQINGDVVDYSEAIDDIYDRTNGLVRYIGTGPNSYITVEVDND